MANFGITWRWLAAGALLVAPALAFATGDSEQSASAATGAATSGRFSEAPMLAARVAAGELPPVEERIPFDPVVQEMLADGVGRYGGTLKVSEAIGFMNQRGGELTTRMLDINMTGSYDEWEQARRLVERGERKLSDYGGELPGTEPPDEWKRYFDWQRQFRTGTAS